MSSTHRKDPADRYDVTVVGAGIVGLAVAGELHRQLPALRLLVIDRETAVGQHQTRHNSGVIHSGVYYQPGSLKARLCVTGAQLMYEYCDAQAIPYDRCGKLIVALDVRELSGLDELERRGHANGVPGATSHRRGRDRRDRTRVSRHRRARQSEHRNRRLPTRGAGNGGRAA